MLSTDDAGSELTRVSRKSPAGGGWSDQPRSERTIPVVDISGATLTDAELLDLCRAGDAESWSVLVVRYTPLVIGVALRAGMPHEDAKDIAQSTFVALLESSTRIRQEERIASWLVTVAHRKAWRARRRLSQELPTAEVPEHAEVPRLDPDTLAVISAAFTQLGEPCRDLLTALYLDPSRPSYAEVAARLGCAIGTVGPTRGRCLEKLRVIIGEDLW